MDRLFLAIAHQYGWLPLCVLLIGLPLGLLGAHGPSENLKELVSGLVQDGPERKASFKNPAGPSTLTEYVHGQLPKPIFDAKLPTEGNLGVRLTVQPDGAVRNVQITEPLHPSVDQEVVRILQATSGNWLPALAKGKAISSEVSLLFPAKLFRRVEYPKIDEKAYAYVDKMPVFAGGAPGLKEFLSSHIQVGGQGLVVLTFVIKQNGDLEDFQVVKSVGPALDAEALRVTQLMQGKWTPGKHKGKLVDVRYTLPVRFPPQ